MAKGGIKINLKGFDKMLENIKAAGGDVDRAAREAIEESAQIVEAELISATKASGVPSSITDGIKKKTSHSGDRYSAEVGWELNEYDPKHPSTGYKAIFLNFGTVRRQTAKGLDRGAIPKRTKDQQFIYRAKKAARPKVKKAQEKILKKAMEDLT